MIFKLSATALRRATAMLLVAATLATGLVAMESIAGPPLGGDAAVAAVPTSIVLATDKTELVAGQSATLTSTTNVDISGSGTLTITDQTTGSPLKNCTTGTTCSIVVTVQAGGPHTYVAKFGTLTSNTVTVSRAAWTVSLATTQEIFAAGAAVTLTATANQNVGSTGGNYRLYIFDRTLNTLVVQCTTGATCAITQTPPFSGGSAHVYAAMVAASGSSTYATAQAVQATSNEITLSRLPWSVALTTNKPTYAVGESVTLTATANQNVGSTGTYYRLYIFDKTTGAVLTWCTSGASCTYSSTALFTSGPAHEYAAVVAYAGATSFSTTSNVQATSNIVTVARQTWTLALTTNKPVFATGESATITATANQSLNSSSFRIYIFDRTTGTMIASCYTGSSCSISASFTTGGPHTYVAAVAPTGTYATLAGIASPEAVSNEVTETRKPWSVVLSVTTPSFVAGKSPGIVASANQAISSGYYIYVFDLTSGTRIARCYTGWSCSAGGEFSTGPAHSYVAVVGAASGDPQTLAAVTDIQATSNTAIAARMPWTIELNALATVYCNQTTLRAYPNQFPTSTYTAYLVDVTTQKVVSQYYSSGGLQYCVDPAKKHAYQAFVADTTTNQWPLHDIQASSEVIVTSGDTPTLEGELVGGGNPSEDARQCSYADPVNAATGEFYLPATDLATPGAGPDFSLARTYSTYSASTNGPFGYGWTANFGTKLNVLVAGDAADPLPRQVQITQENGSTVVFHEGLDHTYFAPARVKATLAFDATSNTWTFTRRSSEVFTFDSAGLLLSAADLHGNTVTFTHGTGGEVTQIAASGGRTIDLTWMGARVTAASDSAGRTVGYTYDSAGNLASFAAADGRTTGYTYSSTHLMLTLTEPGGAITTNVYDSSKRVTSQTDPVGRVTAFAYGTSTTVTAPDGSKIAETYTGGRLVSKTVAATSAIAATTSYVYDTAGNMTSVTDALGRINSFTYDGDGNMLTRVDALGRITRWTYDTLGHATSLTNPLGQVDQFAYDAAGNMLSSTSSTGKVLAWTYNTDGTMATYVSAGKTTSFAYDAAGRLTSSTDPAGSTTSIAYNSAGIPTGQTLPGGAATSTISDVLGRPTSTTDALGNTTTYAYDAYGNVTDVTDAGGNVTHALYDAAGQKIAVTDANGHATTYTYTLAAQLKTVTDPLNHTTTLAYDAAGQLKTATDALGRVTTYGYDLAGQQVSVTAPSGAVTQKTYDAAGQLRTVTDALGKVSRLTYDALGRVLTVTDPLGRITTNAYNTAGQVSSVTTPDQAQVLYTYTGDGQLATYTNGDGLVTSYTYDSAGLLASKTEPGAMTTSFSYNAASLPSVITRPDGSTASVTYNANGQQTAIAFSAAGSTPTTFAYDTLGRTVSMGDSTGESTYAYNAVGQLTAETNGAGAEIVYGYDNAGQLVRIEYPDGNAVTYSHDAAGQMTHLEGWAGTEIDFTWTLDGQLATRDDSNGVGVDQGYDATGRLTSIQVSDSSATLAAFGYTFNDAGELVSEATTLNGLSSTRDYTLDPVSQLATVGVTPAGESTTTSTLGASAAGLLERTVTGAALTYNAAQQVVSSAVVLGPETTFTYDARGSRVSATVAATANDLSVTTDYTYAPSGALASVATPDVSVSYTSDGQRLRQSRTVGTQTQQLTWSTGLGLPVLLSDGVHDYLYGPSLTPLAQVDRSTGEAEFLYTDLLGSVRAIADDTGVVTATTTFDAHGSVAVQSGAASSVFGFTGNWTDPDMGLVYLRARDYDAATGQFLTVDPAVDTTRQPYAYAGNNPVLNTDPTGLDFLDDVNANIGAGLLGVADGLTGGVSSSILSAVVPGYDCFVQEHNVAFQVGSVGAQVVQAAVIIIGTAGVGTGLVVAGVVARVAIKEALHAGVAAAKKLVVTGASSLRRTVVNAFERGGARTAERLVEPRGGVYTLRNEANEVVRTGRTNDFASRQSDHARDEVLGDFRFQREYATDSYNEQRGLEQLLYERHPEARLDRGGYNREAAIDPRNKNWGSYMVAAFDFLIALQ